MKMEFTETSAKQSINVDQMIESVIQAILKKGIKCATKKITLEKAPSEKVKDDSGCC